MKKLLGITLVTLAVAIASAQLKPVQEGLNDNDQPPAKQETGNGSPMESLNDFMEAMRGNPTSPPPALAPKPEPGSGNAVATSVVPSAQSPSVVYLPGKTRTVWRTKPAGPSGHGALWTPMLKDSGVLATGGVNALIDKKLAGSQSATTAPTGAKTPGGEKRMNSTTAWDPTVVVLVVLGLIALATIHWIWGNYVRNRSMTNETRATTTAYNSEKKQEAAFSETLTKGSYTLTSTPVEALIAEATARAEIAHAQLMAAEGRREERRLEREAMLASRQQAANPPPMLVPVYAIAGNAATPPTPAPAPTPEPGRLTVAEIERMQRLFGTPAAQPAARPNRAGGGNAGAAAAPAPATP
mgnify:CR=1 FL=1